MDEDTPSDFGRMVNEIDFKRSFQKPGDYVRLPTSEDEAFAMVCVGVEYLKIHAPHRLKKGT